jgi:hypothetical protein
MKTVIGRRPTVERVQVVVRAVKGSKQTRTVSLPVWRGDGTPPPFDEVVRKVRRAVEAA